MVMIFDHNTTTPPRQPTSLLSKLMDEVWAKSASILRFLYDKEDDVLRNDDDDHCNNKIKNVLFDDIVNMEVDAAVCVAQSEPTMGSNGRERFCLRWLRSHGPSRWNMDLDS